MRRAARSPPRRAARRRPRPPPAPSGSSRRASSLRSASRRWSASRRPRRPGAARVRERPARLAQAPASAAASGALEPGVGSVTRPAVRSSLGHERGRSDRRVWEPPCPSLGSARDARQWRPGTGPPGHRSYRRDRPSGAGRRPATGTARCPPMVDSDLPRRTADRVPAFQCPEADLPAWPSIRTRSSSSSPSTPPGSSATSSARKRVPWARTVAAT